MARLILNLPGKPTVTIDGVLVSVNHDHIHVSSDERSLLRTEDIVSTLDRSKIYCDYDKAGGVIINKPEEARFHDWAIIH